MKDLQFKNLSYRENKVVNLLVVAVIQKNNTRIPPCQTFDVNATTVQTIIDPISDQILLFIKSNRVEYFVKNFRKVFYMKTQIFHS